MYAHVPPALVLSTAPGCDIVHGIQELGTAAREVGTKEQEIDRRYSGFGALSYSWMAKTGTGLILRSWVFSWRPT